ncbi:hypothetical protein HUJ05_002624 [Dendroctonus ponderosae]|nr:hypothetical protein HUJ05_002624 [Dendroctonus ponderosae]
MMHKTKKSSHSNSHLLIWVLAAIRILLVVIPQLGYIHPDEYFQSMEVLAGRIFDVDHSPPWEFETTHPIRGVAIPFFTTGLSYIFLRDINNLAMESVNSYDDGRIDTSPTNRNTFDHRIIVQKDAWDTGFKPISHTNGSLVMLEIKLVLVFLWKTSTAAIHQKYKNADDP